MSVIVSCNPALYSIQRKGPYKVCYSPVYKETDIIVTFDGLQQSLVFAF